MPVEFWTVYSSLMPTRTKKTQLLIFQIVLEANFGVFVASLPALRSLFSGLTELATRLLSGKPSSYEHTKRTNNQHHSQRKSFGRLESDPAVDTDGVDLIPMNNIAAKATTAV